MDELSNAVGVRQNGSDEEITREVVLLGHMDTVPGKIPVRIEDGILYGRGSVDAKGPLATFVMAAAQANLPLGTRLVVVGAVEEECATSKGARHIATQYKPDMCIIGEPSGWDAVTLGYKGRLLIHYRLDQAMSHTAGPEQAVGQLSGGNQQKAVFARSLLGNPKLLLLEEPTRGVDVGAKWEIYQLVRALSQTGCAVILTSSDLPEILGMCDRVLVLQDGRQCQITF